MLKYAISLHVYVAFGLFKWLKSQHSSLFTVDGRIIGANKSSTFTSILKDYP